MDLSPCEALCSCEASLVNSGDNLDIHATQEIKAEERNKKIHSLHSAKKKLSEELSKKKWVRKGLKSLIRTSY